MGIGKFNKKTGAKSFAEDLANYVDYGK